MQLTQSQPKSFQVNTTSVTMLNNERWLVGLHILSAFFALFWGALMGPFQTFHRSPAFVAAFPNATMPIFSYYYQALTAHGVLNALFFTTMFITGISYYVAWRSFDRPLVGMPLAWVAYALELIGLVLLFFVLLNDPQRSAVLFTFYPPLIAPPLFYIGLVLLVVGSWLGLLVVFLTYGAWRKENKTARIPLAPFGVMANYVMYFLASLGVAVEVLVLALPASLGLIQNTDPQLSRALFWFFGHPVVYFWLIPAYVSWYTMLPMQAGAKRVFSEPLAKIAFLMLMIFSVPTGLHHMFADPGISSTWKAIHTVFTLMVAVPSFMTAFNIGATLEIAGRNRGGKGLFGWMFTQKWSDPVVAAQLMGMLQFITGGVTGLINASAQINTVVHNTSWVPAHFHQTVGGAVALTYIGIMYWLLPMIRGRALYSKKMALAQVYTWGFGMTMFGHTLGEAGLAGVPRRTLSGLSPYLSEAATYWLNANAISGVILLVSVILLYANIVLTLFASKEPVTEGGYTVTKGDPTTPALLERWGLWIGVAVVLAALVWTIPFIDSINLTEGFQILRYSPAGPVPLK